VPFSFPYDEVLVTGQRESAENKPFPLLKGHTGVVFAVEGNKIKSIAQVKSTSFTEHNGTVKPMRAFMRAPH
jgi:hypothetical protein